MSRLALESLDYEAKMCSVKIAKLRRHPKVCKISCNDRENISTTGDDNNNLIHDIKVVTIVIIK